MHCKYLKIWSLFAGHSVERLDSYFLCMSTQIIGQLTNMSTPLKIAYENHKLNK